MDKYIIFNASGPLDKNIAATAVVSSIKKGYPEHKIVVISEFSDVWLHNPDVYRVYQLGRISYFYDDFVKEKDTIFMWQDPYNSSDFLNKKKHLIEAWCDLCGVPCTEKSPKLYFTHREKEATMRMMGAENSPVPIFLVETTNIIFNDIPYVWFRDMPKSLAQRVSDKMREMGYRTIHLLKGNEPALLNTDSIFFNNVRQMLCSIIFADKCFLTNSSMQHAAKALDKNSVVLWTAGDPDTFGYDTHTNILPKQNTEYENFKRSYNEFFFQPKEIFNCPFNVAEQFSSEEIVKKLL